MADRTLLKIANGWTTVSDRPDEASYRFPTKAKAQAHLDKLIAYELDAMNYRASSRDARLRQAQEYLTRRAARPTPAQLTFGF